MKRTASRALVAALAVSLALSGAVMAKGHPSHGPKADQGTTTGQADKTAKVAKASSLRTKGNASHPGGVFRVLAVVKAGPADRPATVDAIVHFASGDLPVVLTRSGGGSAYHANVPVPAAEPAGTVLIDATAVVLGVTLTATGSGKIVIGDTAEAPESAVAPASPAVAAAPVTCTSPEESEAPEASEAPDASDSAEESEAPEASDAPDADESSDDCDSDDGHNATLSAEAIAKLVAFIESLFA